MVDVRWLGEVARWSGVMSRMESKSVWTRFGRQDHKEMESRLVRSPTTPPAPTADGHPLKPGLY
jgi:hypothetical protein